jgi:hypothetical protein
LIEKESTTMFQPFHFAPPQQLPAGYPGYQQPAGFAQVANMATPWISPSGQVVMPRQIAPAGQAASPVVLMTPTVGVLVLLSTAFSAYHGYRRNHESIPYGGLWGFFGAVFPVITPVVAVIQGYAKPEKK